jgi:hypothetical protein
VGGEVVEGSVAGFAGASTGGGGAGLHACEGDVGFVGYAAVVCGEGLETVLSRASQRHVGGGGS